ncbi:MAG TPA: hypothetical protein VJ551_01385 [Nitrososphaeraceae archaeon]|nr:hypothetical protein [Nitrososphaeraceae archaeon]
MVDREQTILASAKRGYGRKYYFMICDICFWCASLLDSDLSNYHRAFLCPACKGSKVRVMPLTSDEVYIHTK